MGARQKFHIGHKKYNLIISILNTKEVELDSTDSTDSTYSTVLYSHTRAPSWILS